MRGLSDTPSESAASRKSLRELRRKFPNSAVFRGVGIDVGIGPQAREQAGGLLRGEIAPAQAAQDRFDVDQKPAALRPAAASSFSHPGQNFFQRGDVHAGIKIEGHDPHGRPAARRGREPVVVGTVHVDVEAAQRLEHLQDEVDVRLLDAEVEAGLARGEPFACLAVFSLGALPADIEPTAGADLLENEAVPEDAAGDGKAVDLFIEVVHRQRGDEFLDVAMAKGGGPLAELGQEPRGGGFLVPAHGYPLRAGLFDGDHPDSRTGLHRIVGDDVDRDGSGPEWS